MYKIAMIGDRDSVLGFMALGFSVHEAESSEKAADILHALAKDKSIAVIFIIEKYASEIEEDMAKYKDMPLPAVVTFPGQSGSTGYGMENIRSAVERAVGVDILSKE